MAHSFTREELFELVWSKPMSKLAKELGVSDVGLAKACKRAGIPVPGLGYWTRVPPDPLKPQSREEGAVPRPLVPERSRS